MQHFCIILNVLFHIHSLYLPIVMSICFQEKLLWSTNPTPIITDRFDRTYMVVVMQVNECHESPVTQSDIGFPHMGESSTCLHGKRVKEAGL
jgi:hypothetical protein